MAESLSSQPADATHDADAVARKQFDITRRGFDQNQVRAYLYSVASTIRAGDRREAELRDRVAAAVRRAHDAEELDENTLTQRLGEETVRVLTAAREAAEAKVTQAEEEAAELLEAAQAEAALIREQADAVLDERTAEAEVAAEAIREEARGELVKAKELAAAEIEAGQASAEELIAEGQAMREEVLRDMGRRRQQAKAQVERLRAGRDRILGTFDTVQEALDEIRTGVKNSLGEAKVAADIAARRVLDERPAGLDELEAEVETARMMGLATTPATTETAETDTTDEATTREEELPDRSVSDEAEEGGEDVSRDADSDEEEADPVAGNETVELDGVLLETVVVDDPVESVEVKAPEATAAEDAAESGEEADSDDETEAPGEAAEPTDAAEEAEARGEDAPDRSAGGDDAAGEEDEALAAGSDEPGSDDIGDLFARLRTEQTEPESGAIPDDLDLFDEETESHGEDVPDRSAGGDVAAGEEDEAGAAGSDEPRGDEPDEVLAALVSTAERRLKRVLADDQNRVLAGLRPKGRGKKRGSPPDQLDLETQTDLYLEAVSAQLEARADSGDARDVAAAREHLAESFIGPLRKAVDAAIESADNPDDKVSAVRAVYRERKASMGVVAEELIT